MNEVVQLAGALNIRRSPAVLRDIIDAFDTRDHVKLALSQATDIDISFLQILIAASRTPTRIV